MIYIKKGTNVMKTRIIYSNFDEKTGISEVIISNKYGEFRGCARLKEGDRPSMITGPCCAEKKAYIKYYKERIKLLNYQIKALKDCLTMIEQTKYCNINSHEARKIQRFIQHLTVEKKEWENKIYKTHNNILDYIREKAAAEDEYKKRMEKKKS